MHIRMGTRGSALALAQCNEVKALLEKAYPQHSFEICVITTKGDRIQHVALDQMKDKGIFVKEIEQQLLEHTIDLAVHSMKDMPSVLDERLCFTETLLREDARDVLVLRNATSLSHCPCMPASQQEASDAGFSFCGSVRIWKSSAYAEISKHG